jgi:hypothetical protein
MVSGFRLTAADVGFCIGCLCQSPNDGTLVRGAFSWLAAPFSSLVFGAVNLFVQRVFGVNKRPVLAVDPSVVSCAARIEPHVHSRYCDRRVRL